MTHTVQLLRGTRVDITADHDKKGHTVVDIMVNGQFAHHFPATSRVARSMDKSDIAALHDRLNGGTYFIVDDTIVDFRDRHYAESGKFIHTDNDIQTLAEVVGVSHKPSTGIQQRNMRFHQSIAANQISDNFMIGGSWVRGEIEIPGMAVGGMFTSDLFYLWSPFARYVNSALMIIRQICSNGMVGMSDFLNNRIPLLNRWGEHLDIASLQIQNRVNDVMLKRFAEMRSERASVAQVSNIAHLARMRLENGNHGDNRARDMLRRIATIAAPEMHLGQYYEDHVFADQKIGHQVPSHLTAFDAWNCMTEMRTHSSEVAESTAFALDRAANGLLFDRSGIATRSVFLDNEPTLSEYSDPDQAFFGLDY